MGRAEWLGPGPAAPDRMYGVHKRWRAGTGSDGLVVHHRVTSLVCAAAGLALVTAAVFARAPASADASAHAVVSILRAVAALAGIAALLGATHLARGPGSRPARLAWAAALCVFVSHSYLAGRDPVHGWTGWIQFGKLFERDSLPALKATPHRVLGPASNGGYDGQFYAQVALDPLLLEPALLQRALDGPCYRARRVLVPALAHAAGLGRPAWVLEAFVLLHGAFFLLLVCLLVQGHLLAPWNIRAALVLAACSLSTGATASMAICLPDLPGAVLIVASLLVRPAWGPAAIALGGLARDTTLLGVVGLLEPDLGWPTCKRNLVKVLLAVAPAATWFAYTAGRLTCDTLSGALFGAGNIDWPFLGIGARLVRAWREIDPSRLASLGWFGSLAYDYALQELVTVVSVSVQLAYAFARALRGAGRWPAGPLERIGLAFALLGICLGYSVWEGTTAAARVLLPLCFVFNLMLLRTRRAEFVPLFLAGNLHSLLAAVQFYLHTWTE